MDRENQQETPTEAEIAWLAGVIECDGTVMLSCHIRSERKDETPKVGVEIKLYNTDAGIVTKAVDILERLGLGHHLKERPQKPMKMADGKEYGGKDPMLILTVKRFKSAFALGRLLEPWMFGDKGHRMRLVIQYLARRIAKTDLKGNAPIDREDKEIIVEFYRKHVKRPGHNRHLVEGLLRD